MKKNSLSLQIVITTFYREYQYYEENNVFYGCPCIHVCCYIL